MRFSGFLVIALFLAGVGRGDAEEPSKTTRPSLFAVYYAWYHDTLENYQRMLSRALRRYKDSPAYLRLEGRPVVYLYRSRWWPGGETCHSSSRRHRLGWCQASDDLETDSNTPQPLK